MQAAVLVQLIIHSLTVPVGRGFVSKRLWEGNGVPQNFFFSSLFLLNLTLSQICVYPIYCWIVNATKAKQETQNYNSNEIKIGFDASIHMFPDCPRMHRVLCWANFPLAHLLCSHWVFSLSLYARWHHGMACTVIQSSHHTWALPFPLRQMLPGHVGRWEVLTSAAGIWMWEKRGEREREREAQLWMTT